MGALERPRPVARFADPQVRLERLRVEAEILDRRAHQIGMEEKRLAGLRRTLDGEADSLAAQTAELHERENAVEGQQAELRRAWGEFREEEARLAAESERIARAEDQLALREERFLRRWRWLIGCLTSFRSLRRSSMQPCDVLFVPTKDGYRLLEQSRFGVAPGAVLQGLLGEERRFQVTKVAALPLENRVCGYLQEMSTKEGGGT